jgi:hypothetical protein
VLEYGVMSQFRAWTFANVGSGQGWATDLEVTPGASVEASLPSLRLGAGYGARITIPFDAVGTDLAVLQRLYLHADWTVSPLWTISLSGGVTYGQNSQLVPVATPGTPGVPPSSINPIRSFSTYPYLSADATLLASAQLSRRFRLRLSAGYVDVGGLGDEGQAAQPRTWGPVAEGALDWDLSPQGTIFSSLSFLVSNVVDSSAMEILTWRERWTHRWSRDLETTLSGGIAFTNSESARFAGASRVLPVASAGLRFFTDVRHAFRLWFDAALAPYVDTYSNTIYQRATATLGIDWYPASGLFLGASLSAATVPPSVPPPQNYGTAGLSAAWAPWTWFTIAAGGFSQIQSAAEEGTSGISAFRQWTTYVSVTFRERTPL